MLQRRVGDDAAVPEIIRADLHRRESGRQRPRRHDVFRLDLMLGIVEEDEIAAHHIDRADREAAALAVQQIEINQLQQSLAQRAVVVIAGGALGAGGAEPGTDFLGLEEAGLAQKRAVEGRCRIAHLAENVAVRRVQPDRAVGDAGPESGELFQPVFRFVAGNDGGVDGADRDPRHPVRLDPAFVQGLVDARLIGPQRAPALQHQGAPAAALRPPADHVFSAHIAGFCVHGGSLAAGC